MKQGISWVLILSTILSIHQLDAFTFTARSSKTTSIGTGNNDPILSHRVISIQRKFDDDILKRLSPSSSSSSSSSIVALNALPPTIQESESVKDKNKNSTTQKNKNDNNDDQEEDQELLFGIPQETAKPLSFLLFAQFLLFIGVGAVIPSIPLYGKEIGLSSASNGLVISAPALALLLLAKPSGVFADIARKPAMIYGMAIIALSDLGTALSTSIIPLLIARLGLGAGRCISESGERGMLADLAGTVPELRGRALSIQQAVCALGIAIGAPAGGLVVEEYGPRAAFLCVTAAASLALVMYSFLPETVEGASNDNEQIMEEKREKENIKWKDLLQDSRWRGLSLFEVGARFGYAAKLASIPILAAAILPGGAIGAGALLSAAGLSGFVGGPAGGYLADRIGAKNTVVLTGITSGLGLILIPFALQFNPPEYFTESLHLPDGAAFSAAVLLWSTSVAAQSPASNAFAQEIAPEGSTATAMALPRAAGDSVYLFAPFILGVISDSGVPDGTDCAIAGLFGLLGIAALNFSKQK